MNAAAPLQNTTAKPQQASHPGYGGWLLQRKCACGSPTSSMMGKCQECKSKKRLQAKLSIGASNDPLEQEADRVADQVLATSVNSSIRGVSPSIQVFTGQALGDGGTAPPSVDRVLTSSGRPLEPVLRQDMEQRFGHDFSRVRVHTDAEAAKSAQDVNALAYTVGQNVVFGVGRFAPGSQDGRRLLAHELTHIVQQSEHSVDSTPQIRRQDIQTQTGASIDERANDPNFLLCLALCELGIPPSLWRTLMNDILSAVSQEYRDRLGDLRGSQEFESFRAGLTVMSTFNKLKLVIGFLGESRIGPLTIERPAAQAIRRALLARLAARGLESATLEVVSQILRKVAIAIEVAVAAGCTTYCGAVTMTNALLDFSSAALGAISSFINVSSQLGAALGQAIARPILIARASMDPSNWNLSALPTRSRAHMQAIGFAFRLTFTPDSFLASMARPLNFYNIPQILVELAQDINATLQTRSGFGQLVTFTADFIGGLTPLQFIDILKDYRLLSFVQSPEVLADRQQAEQIAIQP